ncbi:MULTISPECIES: ADP-ribosyltransferase domain-containing protein [unclassified Bradyrhizobium]|uniref:ADP-ribosyltransferase domain-containing protein n=1 Tax=unclassified Bradyrhizobium TaxID=2631580 RepID=UPI0029169AC7|nr:MULTISPECIES: ADP-ribosyltransferase domain-containing protein [unclassified Bradyrhizobium]
MDGHEFFNLLCRLIGNDEAARCLRKICTAAQLDSLFHEKITNTEALAFYVYSTANGWHSYINEQLWSGNPAPDVLAFAAVLNRGLSKIIPIRGKPGTVYRGYSAPDLNAFSEQYPLDRPVHFPAFTSASFSETGAFGGNVLFIIRALSARSIWWLSPNFHEEEALLPTGCTFLVIDKEFLSAGEEQDKLVVVLQETSERP